MLKDSLRRGPARDVLRQLRLLGLETGFAVRNAVGARRARREFAGSTELQLHYGCGADLRSGWVNVDMSPDADVYNDARRGLPFADGSAAIVLSEHFVEHLELEDAQAFFAECHRVLRLGGILSVCVPDAGANVLEYAAGGGALLEHARASGAHGASVTKMDQLNSLFRQGGQHRYAWDAPTLCHYLEQAGFDDAAPREFDPELDSPERRLGSLYVSATRS